MKLSIITVNFNNRDGLQRTIDSVVCQTWRDFEWIIIDGGSTDGSRELIAQYQSHFAYWCSEPDKGVYDAMNKGIEKAKGEYLNFMNSGDCFKNNDVIERIFSNFHTADVLYGYMLRGKGDFVNAYTMKKNISWVDLYYDGLPHQACFIRKFLFEKYGLYDTSLKAVADWKFFVKAIVFNSSSYEFIPLVIAIYEGNGISVQYGSEEKEIVRKELFPEMIARDIYKIDSYNIVNDNRFTHFVYKCILKLALLLKNK